MPDACLDGNGSWGTGLVILSEQAGRGGRTGGGPKRKRTLRVQRSRPCPIFLLLIARLTISEQHYPPGVGDPESPILARSSVLQNLKDGFAGSDQLFVPHSCGKGRLPDRSLQPARVAHAYCQRSPSAHRLAGWCWPAVGPAGRGTARTDSLDRRALLTVKPVAGSPLG